MAYRAIKGAWYYISIIICASDDLFRISVPVPVPVPAFHVFHLPVAMRRGCEMAEIPKLGT